MTDFDLREFYIGYGNALNERRYDDVEKFVADKVVLNGRVSTREEMIANVKATVAAVPDFRWELDEFLVDGERIAARVTNTGTPEKEWMGVKPTGRSFRIVEHTMYRVTDGRFVEMNWLHDAADAARQLGTDAA
ncbi:ester cyclase [Streptomyces sp. NPDC058459]|uniref:ester cyclase n=1 Tax=Streptomyces sp. NPDC058459 TaxID=3346508 RepID=UPI00366924CB